MTINRRQILAGSAGIAATAALGTWGAPRQALAQNAVPAYTPEKGASLRLLRWVPFVAGEEEAWNANTRAFTEATGVEVRIEQESWEDVRPKAAVAANIGSGPDIVMGWFDDVHQYPDKLVDLTELGEALGKAHGGWYPGLEGYARRGEQFIALPLCAIGNAICYRASHVEAAGFSEFPKDTGGFLELCKVLQAKGTPAGFTHGKAVGDGNNYVHWLLWSHGGRAVDEKGAVAIDSAETRAALEYARALYNTFIPGTESWLDINNNRAFLAGQVSVVANGVSLYYAARNDPALKEIADDIRSATLPVGPVGEPVELHQTSTLAIFNHTPYPEAAKAYLAFMYQADRMNKWIEGASAYCCQPLRAFENNPVWKSTPIHEPYSRASASLKPNGWPGPLGYASAAVMADYVLVDLFAEAVTGQRSFDEAIANAERRLNRYYRV